jgi:hypothetical protein
MAARGWTTLAAALFAAALAACDAPAAKKPAGAAAKGARDPWILDQLDTKVDPALLGRWERTVDNTEGRFVLTFDPDPAGRYRLAITGPRWRPDEVGAFEAKDGKWTNRPDGGSEGKGAYSLKGTDEMTFELEKAPSVAWRRVGAAPTRAAPAEPPRADTPDGLQPIAMKLNLATSLAKSEPMLIVFLKTPDETQEVPKAMEPFLEGGLVVRGQYGRTKDDDYARDMVRRFAVDGYPTWIVARAVCRKDEAAAFLEFERVSGPAGTFVEEKVRKAFDRARGASPFELLGRPLIETSVRCPS